MASIPSRWQHLESYVYQILRSRIELYDYIMAMETDVEMISKTYDFSKEAVFRAKNYAFGMGVTQYGFYPDLDMAEAWMRLAEGQGTSLDLVFLNHEVHESDLVQNQGFPQLLAHEMTQALYPWSSLLKRKQS